MSSAPTKNNRRRAERRRRADAARKRTREEEASGPNRAGQANSERLMESCVREEVSERAYAPRMAHGGTLGGQANKVDTLAGHTAPPANRATRGLQQGLTQAYAQRKEEDQAAGAAAAQEPTAPLAHVVRDVDMTLALDDMKYIGLKGRSGQ